MTRTDNGEGFSSRYLAECQEKQERMTANLTKLIGDLSEQVALLRVGQERISNEILVLQASLNTNAAADESKLWRQWAQSTVASAANVQKEHTDRLLSLMSVMTPVATAAPAQPALFPQMAQMPQLNLMNPSVIPQLHNLALQQNAWNNLGQQLHQHQQQQQQHQQQVPVQVPTPKVQTPAPVQPQQRPTLPVQVAPETPKVQPPAPAQAPKPQVLPTQVAPVTPKVQVPTPTPAVVKVEPKAEEKPQTQGWGDKFKPKPGSWECKGCYIRQEADVSTCLSCGTSKDGKTASTFPAKSIADPAPTNTFGSTLASKPLFGFSTAGSSPAPTSTAAPASATPAPASKPTFSFSTASAAAPASTASASPASKPTFSFSTTTATPPTNTSGASPASKPLFSFTPSPAPTSESTTASANTSGSGSKVFGSTAGGLSFASINKSGNDIFEGKQSTVSSFGDPSAIKFGQPKTDKADGSFNASTSKSEADHDDPEAECDAHFEPVVPLPSLIEVRTGEEEEEVVFCERGRIYRFLPETKEYKERGTGDIKVLRNPQTNRYRVVMRREQVHKLCANFALVAGMKVMTRNDGKCTCMFSATDFAEDATGEQMTLTMRFRTEENRDVFVAKFEEGVEAAVRRQQTEQESNEAQVAEEHHSEAEQEEEEDNDEYQLELEVTASIGKAYPSPLNPGKPLKNARVRILCLKEEISGVGEAFKIYFYDLSSNQPVFNHFIRDEINLVDKDDGVTYTASNPEGVPYKIDLTFDSAEDDDMFRDCFHEGIMLVEGEYDDEEDYEDEEEYDE